MAGEHAAEDEGPIDTGINGQANKDMAAVNGYFEESLDQGGQVIQIPSYILKAKVENRVRKGLRYGFGVFMIRDQALSEISIAKADVELLVSVLVS